MIRFAEQKDILSLQNIWRACFDDTEFYISSYYLNRPSDVMSLVSEQSKEIVSMLDLIPVSLCLNDKEYTALYIYAAATLPDFRGQSIMHKLIKAAADIGAENRYDFLCLVPQNEGLVSFYREQGFSIPVYRDLTEVKKDDYGKDDCLVGCCSEEKFTDKKIRYEKKFSKAVLHTSDFCLCLYRQTLAGGGSVLSVGDNYAVCYLSDNKELFVQEISSSEKNLQSDINAICKYYGVQTATVARNGDKNLYGLFRPLGDFSGNLDSVYMNTMLD